MAIKSDFINFLLDLLQPFQGVTAKSMFGGFGLFKDGMMFGLVADDTLYFKVDDQNKAKFIKADLKPFMYRKGEKEMAMSYYNAPEEALDNSDEMLVWAQLGFDAALRKKK